MGLLLSTRRMLLESRGIKYFLRAWMGGTAAQAYADGQVLDTPGEGVLDGTGTIVEKDGTLSVVGGKCAFTAQATPAWGDLGVYSQAITRVLGRGLLVRMNIGATTKNLIAGWFNAASLAQVARIYDFGILSGARVRANTQNGIENPIVATYAATTDYQFAVVLGGYDINGVPFYASQDPADYLYGAAFYIEGGTFTTWTLLWRTMLDNTATLYAAFSNYSAAGTLEKFRVPDVDLKAILQPTALSTFTAANGTDLATGYTPEVGGVWTEQTGNFDIQSNRANAQNAGLNYATVDVSISDGVVDSIINISAAGGTDNSGLLMRFTNTNNCWSLAANASANQLRLWEVNGGVATQRASTAVAIVTATDYDVRAIIYAQTIDGFLDGSNKITYGSATLNETITVHGIFLRDIGSQADNFAIFPRTSPTYDATLGAV